MSITDVRIKSVNDNTKVVAKASVTHGFSIVDSVNTEKS